MVKPFPIYTLRIYTMVSGINQIPIFSSNSWIQSSCFQIYELPVTTVDIYQRTTGFLTIFSVQTFDKGCDEIFVKFCTNLLALI